MCTSSYVRPANKHSCRTVKALFKAGRKIILVSSCPVGQYISVFSYPHKNSTRSIGLMIKRYAECQCFLLPSWIHHLLYKKYETFVVCNIQYGVQSGIQKTNTSRVWLTFKLIIVLFTLQSCKVWANKTTKSNFTCPLDYFHLPTEQNLDLSFSCPAKENLLTPAHFLSCNLWLLSFPIPFYSACIGVLNGFYPPKNLLDWPLHWNNCDTLQYLNHGFFFNLQDFGDGGAFPEIHVAQYPFNELTS